jgi:hypothetical protein
MLTTHTFSMGQILATPGALAAIEDSGQVPADFLDRHSQRDWGDVCDDDKQANEDALLDGSRLLSVYRTSKGVRLWIITEGADDSGARAVTTILLPEDSLPRCVPPGVATRPGTFRPTQGA